LDFRASHGEQITGDSWVLRNAFRTVDMKGNVGQQAKATEPKKLSQKGITRLLIRAWYEQGLWEELPEDVRRHPFKGAHGTRKFFKTRAEYAGTKRGSIELFMGHSLGLSNSYMKPSEHELLEDYLKAVPALTIGEDLTTIKKQQEILEQKGQKQEEEIEKLKQKYTESSHIMFQYFINELESVKEKYEAKFAEMVEAKFAEMTQAPQRINKVQEGIDNRLREQYQQQQQEKT
jgi:hypothetical protein